MKVISDINVTGLERIIAHADPSIKVDPLPYGQAIQSIYKCIEDGYDDIVVLWLEPASVLPSFAKALNFEPYNTPQMMQELDDYLNLLRRVAQNCKGIISVNFTMPAFMQGSGLANLSPGNPGFLLSQINLKLYEALGGFGNAWCLDQSRWFQHDKHYNGKLYHAGKIPFTQAVFSDAADDIVASLRAIRGEARKLLVLDLDDTLWGGTLGDDGRENLKLGSPGAIGEAHAQFQREVKALKNRGIALAIASKNYEDNALDALRNHPEMQLDIEDFSAWRINWNDKATNIAEIAAELNLGLQSVVFIDDNPAERGRVAEALPEVYVPDWPKDPCDYVAALRQLRCFSVPALSDEDTNKTKMFLEEKQRTASKEHVSSREDWLASMGMKLTIENLSPDNGERVVQLINKTNQFNLRTRRTSKPELQNWLNEGNQLFAFRVSDRFGDMGLTGILGLSIRERDIEISDFILSCRVMGRDVEKAMLSVAAEYARSISKEMIRFSYKKTAKNRPIFDFLRTENLISEDNYEGSIAASGLDYDLSCFKMDDQRG